MSAPSERDTSAVRAHWAGHSLAAYWIVLVCDEMTRQQAHQTITVRRNLVRMILNSGAANLPDLSDDERCEVERLCQWVFSSGARRRLLDSSRGSDEG